MNFILGFLGYSVFIMVVVSMFHKIILLLIKIEFYPSAHDGGKLFLQKLVATYQNTRWRILEHQTMHLGISV
jgi:hypothetical protein